MEEGDTACTSACQIPMNRKDFVDLYTKHIQEDCVAAHVTNGPYYNVKFGNCFMEKLTSRKNFLQEESGLLARQVLNKKELDILKRSNYDLDKKNCKCVYHIVLKQEFDELDSFQKARDECSKLKIKAWNHDNNCLSQFDADNPEIAYYYLVKDKNGKFKKVKKSFK
jgi:hypothetical protein